MTFIFCINFLFYGPGTQKSQKVEESSHKKFYFFSSESVLIQKSDFFFSLSSLN